MLKYSGFFRNGMKHILQYRFNFIVSILATFLTVLSTWFIWKAIYSSVSTLTIGGFSFIEMITYLIVVVAFNIFIRSDVEHFINYDVRSGEIAEMLIKPISYPIYVLSYFLGEKTIDITFKIIPVLTVIYYMLNIIPPQSALFLVSLIFAFLINYLISFLVGCWSFWSKGSIWGLSLSKSFIILILSGGMVPITLFPEVIQKIIFKLPFYTIFHIPVSIYVGKITSIEIFNSILLQIFWFIVLISISYFVWNRAKKKMFIQGG